MKLGINVSHLVKWLGLVYKAHLLHRTLNRASLWNSLDPHPPPPSNSHYPQVQYMKCQQSCLKFSRDFTIEDLLYLSRDTSDEVGLELSSFSQDQSTCMNER